MGFWIASILLLFVAGYWLGKWQNRNYKRDRRVALARKLQLIAERNEHMGYRRKHQRPLLTPWQKWLLAFLYGLSPTLTRYTTFRADTLVGWHKRYVKRWWRLISLYGKHSAAGRPKIDPSVEQIILDIKADNQRYGAERIARFGKQADERPDF